MPLKLNKISDATIHEDIVNNRERLEKFLAAPPSSPMRSDPIRYSRRLAEAALELGLELFQQEGEVSEIRRSLALAGKELFVLLSLDQEAAVLSPLEFEKACALSVCFCPPDVYHNADKIPMRKFFADAQALAFYKVLASYLDVLRGFLATRKLHLEAWNNVEAECLRGNSTRYDAQVSLAKLRALKAVDMGDAKALNDALATLVEDHENEARRGENQRSTRGFVCLPALMFAHLGTTRNLSCRVVSPYLPIHLLGQ